MGSHKEAEILTRIPTSHHLTLPCQLMFLHRTLQKKRAFCISTKIYIHHVWKDKCFMTQLYIMGLLLPSAIFARITFLDNDIKANNIVIQENQRMVCPVLIDFGEATFVHKARGMYKPFSISCQCPFSVMKYIYQSYQSIIFKIIK